jgi:hypothetical protein
MDPTTADATGVSEQAPLTAAVTVAGELQDPDGATTFSLEYRVFAGRPELWVRSRFVTTMPTAVLDPTPGGEVTRMLRPLQLAVPTPTTCEVDPGLAWADASTGTRGLTWVWAASPTWRVEAACEDGQTWSAANDYRDVTGMPSGSIPTATAWVDGPLVVLLPHVGPAAGAEAVRTARLQPPTVELGVAEVP